MSTLNATADYERLYQQWQDNRAYLSNNSLVMARLYIEAIDGLVVARPTEARAGGTGGEMLRFDPVALLRLRDEAQKWLNGRNIAASQITHLEYCNE